MKLIKDGMEKNLTSEVAIKLAKERGWIVEGEKPSKNEKEELFAKIEELGLEKPHHATGIDKLKELIADAEEVTEE